MTDFKQYNLEPEIPVSQFNTGLDFISSGNILRTEKNFNIKDRFFINDIEAHNKIGSKINVTLITQALSSVYSISLNDFIIAVRDVGVSRNIRLPKASSAGLGKVFIIKDASGSALTTTITITPDGTEVIDGDTTKVINTNFGLTGLYTDGANWFTA